MLKKFEQINQNKIDINPELEKEPDRYKLAREISPEMYSELKTYDKLIEERINFLPETTKKGVVKALELMNAKINEYTFSASDIEKVLNEIIINKVDAVFLPLSGANPLGWILKEAVKKSAPRNKSVKFFSLLTARIGLLTKNYYRHDDYYYDGLTGKLIYKLGSFQEAKKKMGKPQKLTRFYDNERNKIYEYSIIFQNKEEEERFNKTIDEGQKKLKEIVETYELQNRNLLIVDDTYYRGQTQVVTEELFKNIGINNIKFMDLGEQGAFIRYTRQLMPIVKKPKEDYTSFVIKHQKGKDIKNFIEILKLEGEKIGILYKSFIKNQMKNNEKFYKENYEIFREAGVAEWEF